MRIKTTIYSNNPEKRLKKYEELIKGKTPIKDVRHSKGLSYCYFESEDEYIQAVPISDNQRGIKNHYVWIDKDFDLNSDSYYMIMNSLTPARMMHESIDEYNKNKNLHIKYF